MLSCCIYFLVSKWMLSPFIVVLSACYQFHLISDPFVIDKNIANIHRVRRGQWSLPNSKCIISLIKLFLYVAFVCFCFCFCFLQLVVLHGQWPWANTKSIAQLQSENTVTIALNCIIASTQGRIAANLQRFQERCSSNKSLSSDEHCPLPPLHLHSPLLIALCPVSVPRLLHSVLSGQPEQGRTRVAARTPI